MTVGKFFIHVLLTLLTGGVWLLVLLAVYALRK